MVQHEREHWRGKIDLNPKHKSLSLLDSFRQPIVQ
jgi:hypothetical protein